MNAGKIFRFISFTIFAAVILFLPHGQPAAAASMNPKAFVQTQRISFQQVIVDYQFQQYVTFEAQIQPVSILTEIEQIDLYVYPDGASPEVMTVNPDPNGMIRYTYEIPDKGWPPFSAVLFKFHTTLSGGENSTSETYSFQYDDNRLDWKSISSTPYVIYWHSDDNHLGQTILKTAITGMQSARAYSGATLHDPVRIFAYSDPELLRTALNLDTLDLMAAHAAPARGVIVLSAVPGPGLQLELERQIPHELSHILLYAMTGQGFDSIPIWLVEGLATISELYPNTDYQRILNAAASAGELIPIETLCGSFPDNPAAAYLAYAQSGSFVNFLYKRYGLTGLDQLALKYADGVSCEAGVESVFGETLSELALRWQQEVLGIDSSLLILQNLSPYLAILLVVTLLPVAPFLFSRRKQP